MKLIQVIKKSLALTEVEKEILKAASEILNALYQFDDKNYVWEQALDNLDNEIGYCDFSDFEDISKLLQILINDDFEIIIEK